MEEVLESGRRIWTDAAKFAKSLNIGVHLVIEIRQKYPCVFRRHSDSDGHLGVDAGLIGLRDITED